MSDNVDVYRIARLLHAEHGVFAADEIKEKIKAYTDAGDYNATKIWYEIEDALNEIEKNSAREPESEEVVS
jgi:hypothetical protein